MKFTYLDFFLKEQYLRNLTKELLKGCENTVKRGGGEEENGTACFLRGQKTRVLRGGAFSNGIGMLTSGWRSASSLVISRWEEVTVPISYKRFSANCLYYVQLSARMKEDVFPTRDEPAQRLKGESESSNIFINPSILTLYI